MVSFRGKQEKMSMYRKRRAAAAAAPIPYSCVNRKEEKKIAFLLQ